MDAPCGFEAMNLDAAANPEELATLHRGLTKLVEYASVKEAAMKARLSGHIRTALAHEATCEDIYSRLPEWARW